jgi:hypothetical protein
VSFAVLLDLVLVLLLKMQKDRKLLASAQVSLGFGLSVDANG